MIFALKNGQPVSISDVERGLACGCICPACGKPLIAKKGAKRDHHFSHRPGEDCKYGYETSLHLAAKAILAGAKQMIIPSVTLQFPESTKSDIVISGEQQIPIDSVALEKKFGGVIPDVVMQSGGRPIFIEIFVTHRIDTEKLDKLKALGISVIEIDLSRMDRSTTFEELSDILLRSSEHKCWKYNTVTDQYLKRFYEISDRLGTDCKWGKRFTTWCPLGCSFFEGKPYANYATDCMYCPYFIAGQRNVVFCSGRQKAASIKDLEHAKGGRPYVPDKEPFFGPEYFGPEYIQEPDPIPPVENKAFMEYIQNHKRLHGRQKDPVVKPKPDVVDEYVSLPYSSDNFFKNTAEYTMKAFKEGF